MYSGTLVCVVHFWFLRRCTTTRARSLMIRIAMALPKTACVVKPKNTQNNKVTGGKWSYRSAFFTLLQLMAALILLSWSSSVLFYGLVVIGAGGYILDVTGPGELRVSDL